MAENVSLSLSLLLFQKWQIRKELKKAFHGHTFSCFLEAARLAGRASQVHHWDARKELKQMASCPKQGLHSGFEPRPEHFLLQQVASKLQLSRKSMRDFLRTQAHSSLKHSDYLLHQGYSSEAQGHFPSWEDWLFSSLFFEKKYLHWIFTINVMCGSTRKVFLNGWIGSAHLECIYWLGTLCQLRC